tara:strand:+ start:140 stop:553 length:414 start_codon:yes stop_codon:yes gene_type:complete
MYLLSWENNNKGDLMKEENKCCLCDKDFKDFGDRNNAEPIQSGDCCKTCNDEQVIPARLKKLFHLKDLSATVKTKFMDDNVKLKKQVADLRTAYKKAQGNYEYMWDKYKALETFHIETVKGTPGEGKYNPLTLGEKK